MAESLYLCMRADFADIVKEGLDDKNIDLLQSKYESYQAVDSDKKSALDYVLREHLANILSPHCETPVLESIVTSSIKLCRLNLATATVPVMLLSDMFDALTLDGCEKLFTFVENGVQIWKEELFFSSSKNQLLRMCNDLLRRLSRSQNTVFCGRILLFLAKFFPFSERSGLNIVSEFNLDNVTEFRSEDSSNLKDIFVEKYSTDDEAGASGTSETKLKIDYNLYFKFWSLQDYFRNPNQCYDKAHWKAFSSHAGSVLQAFKSFKLDDQQNGDSVAVDVTKLEPVHYFAKYLTNQKLLELQLSDCKFRRYVLVQFLIVFQYLNSQVKFKGEDQELKSDQVEWIRETTATIYSLLEETPPNGAQFVKTVKHMLKREEYWSAWKNDSCPQVQKKSQNSDEPLFTRSKKPKKYIGDLFREAESQNKTLLGNPELTRLWNLNPDNMDSCRSKERDFLPSLEAYFEEAIEQSDPASMIDEQYKHVYDGNFGWRALRLLATKSPHFFTQSTSNQINKLPEYLEMMVKKIAKDRPVSSSSKIRMQSQMSTDESQKTDATVDNEITERVNENDEEVLLRNEEKEQPTSKHKLFSEKLLDEISVMLAPSRKRLALKLGFRNDDIEYYERSYPQKENMVKNMLQIWSEDDEDASIDGFIYMLEGLGLNDVADICRSNK